MDNVSIEPELSSLQSKLEREIANDEKEVEFRRKRIERNQTLLKAVRGSLSVINPDASDYGSKSETIREAIKQMNKTQFTQQDIEDQIAIINPGMELNRDRIRSALWTMSNKGELKIGRKGTNTAPAIYEKVIRTHAVISDSSRLQQFTTPRASMLTPADLEAAVRNKMGRVNDIAERLGTTPTQIMSLLEPASKVYVADRGWLKIRERPQEG